MKANRYEFLPGWPMFLSTPATFFLRAVVRISQHISGSQAKRRRFEAVSEVLGFKELVDG